MVKLKFKPFLPKQEKPEKFDTFREIASSVYKNLNGSLTFIFIESLNQFEIEENTTEKSNAELKNMLGENSNYLN